MNKTAKEKGGNMTAEEKMRKRIREVLEEAGIELDTIPFTASKLEAQISQLFADYSRAPKYKRDEIYRLAEEKILDTLRHDC